MFGEGVTAVCFLVLLVVARGHVLGGVYSPKKGLTVFPLFESELCFGPTMVCSSVIPQNGITYHDHVVIDL